MIQKINNHDHEAYVDYYINYIEVDNNIKSNTKNLLKEMKDITKFNHTFYSKRKRFVYPPPYPIKPPHNTQPGWKEVPPKPNMHIKTYGNNVTLIWDLNLTCNTAEIKMYELFVCQEKDAYPCTSMWKKKSKIKAEMLPMGCDLEVFEMGYIYHFALRAVDVHKRCSEFATGKTKVY